MPRIGRHPLKEKSIIESQIVPKRVTMTTIVYIPSLEGYWKESYDVLKLFFNSLNQNTNQPFDLMVFDNGSCKEIIDYLFKLRDEGIIQFLILSDKNIRKLGALNYLLQSAPGEYVSYADSDVYFLPGWLDESLKALATIPEAAKVTALPIVGGDTTHISKGCYQKANSDSTITVETGKLVPDTYIEAHSISIGKSLDEFNQSHPDRVDTKLTRKEISVYLSTADFQFTIRNNAIYDAVPLVIKNHNDYFDPIYSPVLEKKLEQSGWWQISTDKFLIHHMGNKIPKLDEELHWLNIAVTTEDIDTKRPRIERKKQIWYLRKLVKYIHTRSYKYLYE